MNMYICNPRILARLGNPCHEQVPTDETSMQGILHGYEVSQQEVGGFRSVGFLRPVAWFYARQGGE
jgi:hypothetical protein